MRWRKFVTMNHLLHHHSVITLMRFKSKVNVSSCYSAFPLTNQSRLTLRQWSGVCSICWQLGVSDMKSQSSCLYPLSSLYLNQAVHNHSVLNVKSCEGDCYGVIYFFIESLQLITRNWCALNNQICQKLQYACEWAEEEEDTLLAMICWLYPCFVIFKFLRFHICGVHHSLR